MLKTTENIFEKLNTTIQKSWLCRKSRTENSSIMKVLTSFFSIIYYTEGQTLIPPYTLYLQNSTTGIKTICFEPFFWFVLIFFHKRFHTFWRIAWIYRDALSYNNKQKKNSTFKRVIFNTRSNLKGNLLHFKNGLFTIVTPQQWISCKIFRDLLHCLTAKLPWR